MILERRPQNAVDGRAKLRAALQSPNARTRWGATQLFNQHFKYVAGDAQLRASLIEDLNDPAPAVRLNAARGLWQWYYWNTDNSEARNGILEALATRLNTESDPTLRRAIHESIYDVLDENTGYLEAWVRASATQEDQDRIHDGYEAVVRDQAHVLAKVLRSATPLGREGILESLWDFHIRHYSLPQLKKGSGRRFSSRRVHEICDRCSRSSPARLSLSAVSRHRRLPIRCAQQLLSNQNRQR